MHILGMCLSKEKSQDSSVGKCVGFEDSSASTPEFGLRLLRMGNYLQSLIALQTRLLFSREEHEGNKQKR